ncbi:SNF2 family N-terminal domain-containing protein [Aspergillus avenaceus]|uniref:SNF2 family N-terminal domain-containing protein n=1 Tax=Aspergillus avenaceus TaxID=36643 RepID=A0A5N6TKB2_ASPAV|nr:SNF2 family N-terminal domain-containing protein [Aspergillus avenaceus]
MTSGSVPCSARLAFGGKSLQGPPKDFTLEIKHKREVFFKAHRHLVRPLLGENDDFYQETAVSANDTIQPYRALDSQPAQLRAVLKPYQLEGLSFLVHLRNNGMGGILGDEMGLGKTIQALALLQYVKERDSILHYYKSDPFLVVCPLSVMETWISEISRWTPGLIAAKFHGSSDHKANLKNMLKRGKNSTVKIDIIVTTYETLISDIRWFLKFVWKYLILDEGHRIKNNQSRRAQTLQKLQAEYKIILTGTPVQNDLREVWSILHWLYPEVFVKATAVPFEEAFCLGDGKFDAKFLEDLRRFLGMVMLRRVKDSPEVGLAIPPMTETVLSIPLAEFQRALYLRILTGIDSLLEKCDGGLKDTIKQEYTHENPELFEQGEGSPIDGLPMSPTKSKAGKRYRILSNTLMELRKCSIHPYMLADAIPDPYELGPHVIVNSGKFVVLHKMIQHFVIAQRKKVIIFSGFTQALNLCEDLLMTIQRDVQHCKYLRLDGNTPSAWRNLSTHLFQKDPRYMIFLISIKAGGEGLNLTSCSTVIFLDEDWNPQVMRQAEARVHRIGQTQPVQIFKMHSKGTVEEQISRRLAKKAYVASKVIENQSVPFAMGIQDWSTLIRSRDFLASDQLNATELNRFDWENVLNICAAGHSAWLKSSEKVKIDIFNGQKVDTRFRSYSIYEILPEDLCREERRIGKERTVIIDGFEVSKASITLESPTDIKSPDLILVSYAVVITPRAAKFAHGHFIGNVLGLW